MTEDEKAVAALIAIGVQIGFAVSGKTLMEPEKQACDQAQRLVTEIKRRGWGLPSA